MTEALSIICYLQKKNCSDVSAHIAAGAAAAAAAGESLEMWALAK